jgi:DNA-binding NarL/FixJ family response regulator
MVPRAVVVDDHAGFRRRARRLLAAAGLDVVGEAADCAQARLVTRSERAEVVLLDVRLPDGSGAVLADELSARGIRVLLTSASSASELDAQLGGHAFVPKQQLDVQHVRRHLGP